MAVNYGDNRFFSGLNSVQEVCTQLDHCTGNKERVVQVEKYIDNEVTVPKEKWVVFAKSESITYYELVQDSNFSDLVNKLKLKLNDKYSLHGGAFFNNGVWCQVVIK